MALKLSEKSSIDRIVFEHDSKAFGVTKYVITDDGAGEIRVHVSEGKIILRPAYANEILISTQE